MSTQPNTVPAGSDPLGEGEGAGKDAGAADPEVASAHGPQVGRSEPRGAVTPEEHTRLPNPRPSEPPTDQDTVGGSGDRFAHSNLVDGDGAQPGSVVKARSNRRRFRRRVLVTCSALVLVTAVVTAWFAQSVPYYSVSPGSLWDTSSLVLADKSKLHPPKGQILFTTVLAKDLTRLDKWIAERDDDTDIIAQAAFAGDMTPEENREFNYRLMSDSKQTAIAVALLRLGYEVDVTGTGAGVVEVAEDLPAAEVLGHGDTVVAVDGEPVFLAADLVAQIESRQPGDEVVLDIERLDGEKATETVALAEREDEPGTAILGVVIETRDQELELPFEVDVAVGDVGGSSAGLAMTLAVIDALSDGELTGGGRVAVTGTIDINGNVGPIGGIKQKAIAVADAGVEVFVVPLGDAEEARTSVPELEVVAVSTLDEALAALEALGGDAAEPVGA